MIPARCAEAVPVSTIRCKTAAHRCPIPPRAGPGGSDTLRAVSLNRPPHELVATVIGAGTMGAQIAAQFANAGIRTHLLDIVPKGVDADAPAA